MLMQPFPMYWFLLRSKLRKLHINACALNDVVLVGSQDVSTEEGLVLFAKSLQRDSSSASSLVACSQQCKEGWSNVLDVLEQCQGQVFTSGIGMNLLLNVVVP